MQPLTLLLDAARAGDRGAMDELFSTLYDEFRRIAHARLRRSAPQTLMETTALVNESYLRLVRVGALDASSRSHFLAYAARVMRSIIVDHARERMAERRGGGQADRTLDTWVADSAAAPGAGEASEIVRVNDALADLAKHDEQLARIVELRWFAGLTEKEIAAATGVTERTVRRHWEKARVLLAASLRSD